MNRDEELRAINPYNLSATQFAMITSTAESVEKWRGIKDRNGSDRGMDNCKLCMYYMWSDRSPCGGCPVSKKSWNIFCKETPYIPWINHQDNCRLSKWGEVGECKECERLANNEFNFLDDLLTEIIESINQEHENNV